MRFGRARVSGSCAEEEEGLCGRRCSLFGSKVGNCFKSFGVAGTSILLLIKQGCANIGNEFFSCTYSSAVVYYSLCTLCYSFAMITLISNYYTKNYGSRTNVTLQALFHITNVNTYL